MWREEVLPKFNAGTATSANCLMKKLTKDFVLGSWKARGQVQDCREFDFVASAAFVFDCRKERLEI